MPGRLDAPLSGRRAPRRRAGLGPGIPDVGMRQFPLGRIVLALILLLVGGVVARVMLVEDSNGGRPVAEVAISSARSANAVAGEVGTARPDPESPSLSVLHEDGSGPSITIIDDSVPDAEPLLAGGVPDRQGALKILLEDTQYGAIPRPGPDGETAFASYARPSIGPLGAGGQPLVAIVVTGLGLNDGATREAIARLPENVTLAFAPYARTLDQTVAMARGEGHETVLELPMEPFDYPDNDPGPHTLLAGQPARANLDKLHWLLARFGGYMGVINHMGARFTASAEDLQPIVEELATRGLGYIDDGASNRSLAPGLALANRMPFARATATLDVSPTRQAILAGLAELERMARRDGQAIGIVSALPVSVDAVAEWAEGLEAAGVLLVPASALMSIQETQ